MIITAPLFALLLFLIYSFLSSGFVLLLYFMVFGFSFIASIFFSLMVLVFSFMFFFPFRLLFQTSLSWWLKKPSWRLTPTKWVVPQYFNPLCLHHDGSLNHYDKENKTKLATPLTVSPLAWSLSLSVNISLLLCLYVIRASTFLKLRPLTVSFAFLHAGMCRLMLRTPTRSKPSLNEVRVNPLHLFCMNWGHTTAEMDASRGM